MRQVRGMVNGLALAFSIFGYAMMEAGFDLPAKADFGVVREGDPVKLELKGKNTGEAQLKLKNIMNSCTCTTARLDKKEIEPGQEAKLTIELDTSLKTGHISKSVKLYFEGEKSPVVTQVTGTVEASGNVHTSKNPAAIFSGKCADCHANPGRRLKGYQLYLADCAFCHGVHGEGLSAKPLKRAYTSEFLKTIIQEGSPDKRMPAFGDKKKGPLSQPQIDSLAQTLENWNISLSTSPGMSDFTKGSLLYVKMCAPCHGIRRTGPIGASITINDLRKYDHQQLMDLLKRKNAPLMPSFSKKDGGLLEDDEIRAIVGYLKGSKFPGK